MKAGVKEVLITIAYNIDKVRKNENISPENKDKILEELANILREISIIL